MAIGPQLRPWLTLTGVTGLRPLPPPRLPAALARRALAGGARSCRRRDAGPACAAGCLAGADHGRTGRSLGPPGVLMLMGPRQVGRSGERRGPWCTRRVAAKCTSLPPIAWSVTPADLAAAVLAAARAVFAERGLDPAALPATTSVERPRNPEHGDYASTSRSSWPRRPGVPPAGAGRGAGRAARPGRRRSGASRSPARASSTSRSTPAAPGELARDDRRGRRGVRPQRRARRRRRINLEFVSANPTGPVHLGAHPVGGGRRRAGPAARGDRRRGRPGSTTSTTPARRSTGSRRSLLRGRAGRADPGGRLPGRVHRRDRRSRSSRARPDALEPARRRGARRCSGRGRRADVRRDQAVAGATSASTSTSSSTRGPARAGGELEQALARLREQGHVFEADGAIWLRTTDFGDDKDRVLIQVQRRADLLRRRRGYYLDKRERGFDRCVYMLGADHHGYIGRLQGDGRLLRRRPGRATSRS